MKAKSGTPIDFSQLISDHFEDLTKSEKRIANYLRKNQEESAFISAAELANRLGLSEATIVRFARTLGFDSYPTMREELQENFRRRVTHSARLRSKLDDMREEGDIFEQVTVTEIDYLTQALQSVSREALKDAVKAIIAHKNIFVFGTGPSITLVDLLNVRLTRFGKHVIPLTTAGRELLEPLQLLTDQDILLAIGFFDVNPSLQIVLEQAQEKNCTVIFLTDTLEALVSDKVDIVLSAKRGPVSAFHSLVVPMTIINTILLDIANKDRENVMTNLDQLDHLRDYLKKIDN